MIWIKENWFKFFLLFAIFTYTLGFLFEQYRLTNVHNLDVLHELTTCAKEFKGSDFLVNLCSNRVKQTYIFNY